MGQTRFGGEEAAALVTELRETFSTGRTRSYEWRVTQLKSIVKLVEEREDEIVQALRSDLNKPEFESVLYEVTASFNLFMVLAWTNNGEHDIVLSEWES